MQGQASVELLADNLGLPSQDLASFELLDEEQIAHLIAALEEAEARQGSALDDAIQNALSHVPALLRKPILKILGR